MQAFLQRGGGRLAHLANSLFHTVDTSQQGALSLKVPFRRYRPSAVSSLLFSRVFNLQGCPGGVVLCVQILSMPPACFSVLRLP